MGEKTLMRPVLITAGVIGIAQGLIWTALSLVAILYYQKVIKIDDDDKVLNKISGVIYDVYLDADPILFKSAESIAKINFKVLSKNFNIFMYFYFGFSVVWLSNSVVIFWANVRNKLKNYTIQLLVLWIVCVCCLSIIDAVLTALIAYDYDKVSKVNLETEITETSTATTLTADGDANVKSLLKDDETEPIIIFQGLKTIILASMGIVMTLAARGYLVWLINLVFVGILTKYCRQLLTKDPRPETSIIDAFGNNTRPPWDLQNSLFDEGNAANFEFTNKGFKNDNNEPIYARSESFHHLQVDPREPRLEENIRDPRSRNGRMPDERRQEPLSPMNNYSNYPSSSNINNFRNTPMERSNFGPDSNQTQPSMEWRAPQVKTAKIGHPGGPMSPPPHNVAPPFIPAPDYSPSNSLRVKGVLRPKSNYMYE